MKILLEKSINEIVYKNYNIDKSIKLDIPPSISLGDFSTNIALTISKELKQNPKEIAETIKNALLNESIEIVREVIIAGPGFINIYLNHKYYIKNIILDILNSKDKFLNLNIGKNKNLSIEHTAANPNKHLHIGHLRNFSIADTLVRVMSNAGYNIKVQYFNNNQGLQVAKVLWGLLNLETLELDQNIKDYFDNTSIETLISSIENIYIDHTQDKINFIKFDTLAAMVYVASEKYLSGNIEQEKEARTLIQQMEEGNNRISHFADVVTENILKGQIETVSRFGVYYDEIITESVMTQSKEVNKVISALFQTGKVVKETEGVNKDCIVIKDLNSETIQGENPDKVLIRADGTALYTAKDIVLHLWKFGLLNINFNFIPLLKQWNGKDVFITSLSKGQIIKEKADVHINVVDQRQSYPLEVVKQSLKVLGFNKESENFYHLGYEFVSMSLDTANILGYDIQNSLLEDTKSIPMSGRKGIEVPIDLLLKMMTDHVIKANESKVDKISYIEAEKIASSSLRYYMIKYNYNTIIVFDINDALRSDGDSGIYLMYAYVRAKSILNKVQQTYNKSFEQVIDNIKDIDQSIIDLINQISFSKDILESVSKNYEVSQLAEYVYNLAKAFTTFYQKINIINETNADDKLFYLSIVQSFETVYKQLLDILGIHTPQKM